MEATNQLIVNKSDYKNLIVQLYIYKKALETIVTKGTSCCFIAIAKEALKEV